MSESVQTAAAMTGTTPPLSVDLGTLQPTQPAVVAADIRPGHRPPVHLVAVATITELRPVEDSDTTVTPTILPAT